MLYVALVIYCTVVFGIHGGEGISGINRQARNALCALPFGLVAYFTFDYPQAVVAFALAYAGVSMGFNRFTLWEKGAVTLFPIGALLLPAAYWIGYKTKYTNVLAEYLSGTFYGIFLAGVLTYVRHG